MKLTNITGFMGIILTTIAAIVVILSVLHLIPSDSPIEQAAEEIIKNNTGIEVNVPDESK